MTHRTFVLRSLLASSLVGLGLLSSPAHALFSDDEARKAILELRKEVRDQSDNHSERLMQSQRVQLQLSQQIDQLQQEVARLRGQIEVLTKQVADTKQAQRDIFLDVDARLKRFEPQTTSIDGEEATVAPDEKRDFDAAIERFRNGSYDQALQALQTFSKAFPNSPYMPVVLFYQGSSHYALKDYRNAILQQQAMVKAFPQNARAADALLIVAGSQIELRNFNGAKATLERIIREYPDAPAAATAKERLELMK